MQQMLTVRLLQIAFIIPVVCRHANQISFSSVRLITLFCISSGHKLIYSPGAEICSYARKHFRSP